MDKVKTVLFGMTGFGNSALKVLLSHPTIELLGVFSTKRKDTLFPYYECEQLCDIAIREGIAVYEALPLIDNKMYKLIKELSPDLIVVGSFNQIVPKNIILLPRLGIINIHPSLLPKYRGATPTVWVLMNGEKETGVTVHFIEDERIDCGRIIAQDRLKIEPSDTDGILRFKLARFSEKVLRKALHLVQINDKEMFPSQDESESTYYPKRTVKDGEISLDRPFKDILNKIRAMSPYPGAYLNYRGKKNIIKDAILLNVRNIKDIPQTKRNTLVCRILEGMIKFKVKEIIV